MNECGRYGSSEESVSNHFLPVFWYEGWLICKLKLIRESQTIVCWPHDVLLLFCVCHSGLPTYSLSCPTSGGHICIQPCIKAHLRNLCYDSSPNHREGNIWTKYNLAELWWGVACKSGTSLLCLQRKWGNEYSVQGVRLVGTSERLTLFHKRPIHFQLNRAILVSYSKEK